MEATYEPGVRWEGDDPREAFAEALASARGRDEAVGYTTVGPHTDDVLLALGGRELRRFGSLGQQQLAAMFLKLSQADLVRAAIGAPPLLLVDEMFAIPAVFTLFAWAFAYLFLVVQALDPGAFGDARGWMDLLFLSFTTLSSTGLSDIVPVTGHARSVIMLEQLAGIFYIAMVVTRLVALRTHRRLRA